MNTKRLAAVAFCCAVLAPAASFGATAGSTDVSKAADAPQATATAKGGQSTAASGKDAPAEADAAAKDATPAADGATADTAEAPVASDELLAWAGSADCATCHTVEDGSMTDEACVASLHGTLGLACVSCHVDDALIDVHAKAQPTAKPPKTLKKSQVPAAVCGSCHDVDQLAETTKDSAVLTDSEGTVVNPHDLPDVKDHAQIACGDCHRLHSSKEVSSSATALCLSCHHEDVYECGTCHS